MNYDINDSLCSASLLTKLSDFEAKYLKDETKMHNIQDNSNIKQKDTKTDITNNAIENTWNIQVIKKRKISDSDDEGNIEAELERKSNTKYPKKHLYGKDNSTSEHTSLYIDKSQEDLFGESFDSNNTIIQNDVSSQLCTISPEDKQDLSFWNLPKDIVKAYNKMGIIKIFPWQVECLCLPGILNGGNLVYSAPTSAGKTLVSEFLLMKRVIETRKKAFFILPFVSIAREKTYHLQNLLHGSEIRVAGFMGSHAPPGGLQNTDVAVCTIEKANNLINKLIKEDKLEELSIIVIDELHMVGDPHRGYLLELMLTKLRYITSKKNLSECVQIVGMSATLPNLNTLATWLNAQLYTTEYRPIPLIEMVKIGNSIYDNGFNKLRDLDVKQGIKNDSEGLVHLCLETILEGFSVLVFCPTKAWCEKIALSIAANFFEIEQLCDRKSWKLLSYRNG